MVLDRRPLEGAFGRMSTGGLAGMKTTAGLGQDRTLAQQAMRAGQASGH
jgi:hypothetical protein